MHFDFSQPIQYCDKRETRVLSTYGTLLVSQPYNIENWILKPAKAGDVGLDLPVRIKNMQDVERSVRLDPYVPDAINWQEGWADIPGNGYAELPAGIHVAIPDDAWGMIRPRSSTGWKKHLQVFSGTIDSGYRGPLLCLVFNPSSEPVRVYDGDRLAQLVLVPKYPLERIILVDELPSSDRGCAGFGSSGN